MQSTLVGANGLFKGRATTRLSSHDHEVLADVRHRRSDAHQWEEQSE
jgi:uncharacterized protein YbjT (DUF2867 family)